MLDIFSSKKWLEENILYHHQGLGRAVILYRKGLEALLASSYWRAMRWGETLILEEHNCSLLRKSLSPRNITSWLMPLNGIFRNVSTKYNRTYILFQPGIWPKIKSQWFFFTLSYELQVNIVKLNPKTKKGTPFESDMKDQ